MNDYEVNVATFDDLLKDPDYQREFDKKVQKAIEKSKAKWQKEADEKRSEAENLAKMSEAEKSKYEIEKLTKERDSARNELNAFKLKSEALKIVSERGMDTGLLDLIDFTKETAETAKEKIDKITSAVGVASERSLNDRLKQASPKQVNATNSQDKNKVVSRASF